MRAVQGIVNAVPTLQNTDHRYDIRPNRSLAGGSAALLVASTAVGTFTVAGFLTLAYGAWPVLPFAGLEILVLAWSFRVVQRRCRDSEVVVVGEEFVDVSRRCGREFESFRFPRHWARVELLSRAARNHPTRLRIGSHGRFVEIGRFLTDDERLALAGAIRGRLGGVVASPYAGKDLLERSLMGES